MQTGKVGARDSGLGTRGLGRSFGSCTAERPGVANVRQYNCHTIGTRGLTPHASHKTRGKPRR